MDMADSMLKPQIVHHLPPGLGERQPSQAETPWSLAEFYYCVRAFKRLLFCIEVDKPALLLLSL